MTEEELLLTTIKKCRRVDLYADNIPLSEREQHQLTWMKTRRQSGEPLQYILGQTEFMGLEFQVDSRVFIPRPETELLVEEVISRARRMRRRPIEILDIGTGSGNIAVSLASLINDCFLTAGDISPVALEVALDNAGLNRIRGKIDFIASDLFSNVEESRRFDIIVSNPPYIPSSQMAQLPLDVQQEPRLALDGGLDGLDFYRRLLRESPPFLKPFSLLLWEMGDFQSVAIRNLVLKQGQFRIVDCLKDYRGTERILILEFVYG